MPDKRFAISSGIAVAAAVMLLGTPTASHALEFHGIPLGASEAALLRAIPLFDCRAPSKAGSGDRLCTMSGGGLSDALGMHSAAAIFVRDRLSWLILKLQVAQFPALVANLKAKFGQPTTHAVVDFKSKSGVEVANDIYTWRVGNEVVEARRFGDNLTASVVDFRVSGVRAELDQRAGNGATPKDPTM